MTTTMACIPWWRKNAISMATQHKNYVRLCSWVQHNKHGNTTVPPIQPPCDSIGDPLGDNQCSPWWTFTHTDCTTDVQNYTSTLLNVVPTELTHHMVEWNAKPMLDWSAKQTVSHVIVMWWSCEIYYQCSPKAFSVISYNSYIIFYPLLVRQQRLH